MTCDDVRQRVQSGEPLGNAELSHVADCLPCAELCAESALLGQALRAASSFGRDGELEGGLAELHRELERKPTPLETLKSQSSTLRVLLLVALVVLLTAVEATVLRRPDLSRLSARALLGFALLTAPTLAVGVWLNARPLWRPAAPNWLSRVVGLSALAVPVLVAVVGLGHTGYAGALRGQGAELLPLALRCFVHGALVAGLFVGFATMMDRGGRRAAVPLAAALGGLVASWALGLHCPVSHAAHLLLGHASVGFMAVAMAVASLTRRRARP